MSKAQLSIMFHPILIASAIKKKKTVHISIKRTTVNERNMLKMMFTTWFQNGKKATAPNLISHFQLFDAFHGLGYLRL